MLSAARVSLTRTAGSILLIAAIHYSSSTKPGM